MGKGGEKGEREAPSQLYSWEEIQKHNLRTDKWLVIEGKVYNITEWAARHPGGIRVISHYAGEDATDAFQAFHNNPSFVQKFLKPLLIGELAPGEPSQDRGKNPQLVNDFRALRKTAEDMNLFKADPLFFSLYLGHIIIMEALAWLMVSYYGTGWITTLILSCILAVSQAQAGWLQHDFGHLSVFRKSRWNHLVHKFVIGHLKIKSRVKSYILGLKKHPWTIFGICMSGVLSTISVTMVISTITYWKSVKRSRLHPQGKTLHKGPMAAFLMQTKDNPMKAVGVLAGVMGVTVVITIMISTAMFWRNKRSNKIMPVRRIIKKRQTHQPRMVRMEWLKFKRSSHTAEKFAIEDDTMSLQNENSNNNIQVPCLPPTAPALPSPPVLGPKINGAEWRVPTVSGSLSPKVINKQVKKKGQSSTHNALVSELKQKFEKRNVASNIPQI